MRAERNLVAGMIVAGMIVAGMIIAEALLFMGSAQAIEPEMKGARRTPNEAAGERYPVVTIPATDFMDLPTPQAAGKRPSWREVERTLERMRQARRELGASHNELAAYYSQLADPKFTGTASLAQHLGTLATWQQEIPDSPSALVVAANAQIRNAWAARGGDTADKVTQNGWQLFTERLNEAHKLLDKAVKLGAPDGETYRALINVALGLSAPKADVRRLMETGRKLDPTYFPIYDQMAIHLLPRWQGEVGEVERFASELTRMLPGDDGLEAMARVALMVHTYGTRTYYGDEIFHGAFDHGLLVRATETLSRRHPQSQTFAQFAALCAMAAQDHQAAKRIRPLLARYSADHKIWLWETSFNHFWAWSGAAESPTSEQSSIWATQAGCSGIAFGTDDRHVWCAQQYGRGSVSLLNVRTRAVEFALPHPGGAVNGLAVDNERKWIAFSAWRDKLVGWSLYDLRRGGEPTTHATAEKCDTLAFHPKLPQIFWTEAAMLRSWDVEKNQASVEFPLPAAAQRIRFSPEGSLIAVDMKGIVVYDTVTGKQKYELPHVGQEPKPAIDCRRLLGFDDGRVIGHAVTIGQQPNKAPVVRFAADGSSWETLIADTRSAESYLSPDQRILAVARLPDTGPSGIDVWDMVTAKRLKHFEGHWNRVGNMAFSPDGRKLASVGLQADVIKIWPLDDVVELNVPGKKNAAQ